MPIVLFRVDERLIHGQVVLAWGSQLRLEHYVVVDEALAQSEWEQELYTLSLPEGKTAEFFTPDAARQALSEWKTSPLRTVVLTRDIQTMLELARGGLLEGVTVNLGGIHLRKGREEVLSYVFLDEGDQEALRALEEEGAHVSAQDLPGSAKVPLAALLD